MAKTILLKGGAAWNFGTFYTSLASGAAISNGMSGTEADYTTIHRAAGTFSTLYARITVSTGANASTVQLRKGAANGNQSLSLTAATTGDFTDNTNTDSVAAGDDWHIQIVLGAGDAITGAIQITFDATTNTSARYGSTDTSVASASTTFFTAPWGDGLGNTSSTEANQQIKVKDSATIKNLFGYAITNSRSKASTLTIRKNQTDSVVTISITGSTTGTFEDTTHSVSVVSGDNINYSITTGTGTGTLKFNTLCFDYQTTDSTFSLGIAGNASTVNANLTRYIPAIGDSNPDPTESNRKSLAQLAFTGSLAECYISANTVSAASTLNFRKNSANGNQSVSITASTTGWFVDSINTDSVATTDYIDFQIVTGATGTSLTVNAIAMLATISSSTNVTVTPAALILASTLVLPVQTVLSLPNAQSIASQLPASVPNIVSLPNALQGNLTLVNPTVSATGSVTISIPALTISLSLVSPATEVKQSPAAFSLTASLQTSIRESKVSPNALSITATLTNPVFAISLSIPAFAAALALQTSTRVVSNIPAAQTITSNLPDVVKNVLNLPASLAGTFLLVNPTVQAGGNKTVSVQPLTISLFLVSPNPAATILPNALSLTAALQASIRESKVSPNALAITSTLTNPAFTSVLSVPALALTLALQTSVREARVSPQALALTLALQNVSLTVQFLASALSAALALQTSTTIVSISKNALSMTLALPGATPMVINVPGSLPITLLLNPVTVSAGGVNKTVIVSPLTITLSVQGSATPNIAVNPNAQIIQSNLPGISKEAKISASALSLALSLPTISQECKKPTGALTVASLLGGVTPQALIKPNAQTINFLLNNPTLAIAFNRTVSVSPLTILMNLQGGTAKALYRVVRIFTHDKQTKINTRHIKAPKFVHSKQPKTTNKINALRRITRANAKRKQVHAGL